MNTPKFKEGDWIKSIHSGRTARVVMLLKTCYSLWLSNDDSYCLDYSYQDNWELTDAPPKTKLEEAAREYATTHLRNNEFPTADSAFIAGAEWQKEQDQPITGNSLEQEWLRYVDRKKKECRGELPALGEYGWLQIARHFAEWQKEQDLKEMAQSKSPLSVAYANRCFENGKQAMKQQMLKDAVKGEVIKTDKHTSVRYKSFYETDRYFYGIADKQFKPGDKVRIIVMKEEEQI